MLNLREDPFSYCELIFHRLLQILRVGQTSVTTLFQLAVLVRRLVQTGVDNVLSVRTPAHIVTVFAHTVTELFRRPAHLHALCYRVTQTELP